MIEADEPARAVRACPRHRLELVELPDDELHCPAGHRCRCWVVMLHGKAVAAGRLARPGDVAVWLPVSLRELRGSLEEDVEKSAV